MAVVTILSVLAHLGVFALVGLTTPGVRDRPPMPDEPMVVSLIDPRREPPTPRPSLSGGAPASGIPRRETAAPLLHVPAVQPPAEVAPSPLPAPTPPGTPAGGKGKGGSGRNLTVFPLPSDLTRNAVRGTYGCSYPDAAGLTRREREACLDRPTKQAKAIDAPMSAEKRGRFDVAAAKQRRDREWRENPTMPSGTSEEQGTGRPAGVGPANPVHAPIKTPF